VGASPSFYIPPYVQYSQRVTEGVVFGTHRLKSVCECLHDGVSEESWGKARPFSRRPPYTRDPYEELSKGTWASSPASLVESEVIGK